MQFTLAIVPLLAATASALPSGTCSGNDSGSSGSSASGSSNSNNATIANGVIKATFTEYGSTDHNGSGTCNAATVACGFFTSGAYYAALSQNYFGVGPGAGAGPACGTCWRLTPQEDSSGKQLSGAHSIVVKVNNLCPAAGNPLCAQQGEQGTNQYGAVANFDTCLDDGASAALFGSSGVGLAVGMAEQVECDQWSSGGSQKRWL